MSRSQAEMAFPQDTAASWQSGMSMRQYVAAKVLPLLLSNQMKLDGFMLGQYGGAEADARIRSDAVAASYKIADEFLAAG